jgi:hypothetical protein
MDDWTAQSIIVGVLGFIGMIGLWAVFLWSLTKDDSPRR